MISIGYHIRGMRDDREDRFILSVSLTFNRLGLPDPAPASTLDWTGGTILTVTGPAREMDEAYNRLSDALKDSSRMGNIGFHLGSGRLVGDDPADLKSWEAP